MTDVNPAPTPHSTPPVVRMGTDLERQLAHLPVDRAAAEVAAHITKFWEPRMQADLVAILHAGTPPLGPVLAAAARLLAAGG